MLIYVFITFFWMSGHLYSLFMEIQKQPASCVIFHWSNEMSPIQGTLHFIREEASDPSLTWPPKQQQQNTEKVLRIIRPF